MSNDEPRRLRVNASDAACPWELLVPVRTGVYGKAIRHTAWRSCGMPRGHDGPHIDADTVLAQLGLSVCAGCGGTYETDSRNHHACAGPPT